MNNDEPLITTLICTYRRPQMLKRAIESVLNQTYQNFQICVYDNASGDNTASIVAEYAKQNPRIKYHCHPRNIGLLENYSYALNDVKTNFFSFLADDDLILPNFYQVALSEFQREPQALLVATSFLSLSFQGNLVGSGKFPTKVLYPPDGLFEFVEKGLNPNLHGVLLKKEVTKTFDKFVHIWDDIDLIYRIAAAYPIVLSSEECLLSITHNLDKKHGANINQAWEPIETISASLKPILSTNSYQKIESIFKQSIKSALYNISIELIYSRDFTGAMIGANKLHNDFGLYRKSATLKSLIFIFKIFPFLLNLLSLFRDLRPYLKGQAEKFPVFSYAELMKIYLDKKYL
jgi:glycosyltransferase involved in cell wall biosynthesis